MAASDDLIDFDVIEAQKENIQALPSGRSAKKLAELFSPSPLHKLDTPTPSDTKNVNDCIRAEYEEEIRNISESDDPLDIFDRYVRWTLDAYPSAQATPQSQLHTLLERATKTFIGSSQYKNDPRYLKIWMLYIQFFSDSPRETFLFLSRHNIGETLALFYEEYAAWLEGAGRWSQAEEVYKLGIEREARPVQRLIRKFKEFEQRLAQQPDATEAPSSPALPTVRPALAAKIDPFAAARAAAAADPQAPRPSQGVSAAAPKPGKAKMAIFSDTDSAPPALASRGPSSKGWDTIGSLGDRKKENVMEPKPWAGETLKAGGKKSTAPKMAIFRDTQSRSSRAQMCKSHITLVPSKNQIVVNPVSGKKERIFVSLEAIYPTPEEPGSELGFEEVWAMNRGWLDVSWDDDPPIEESAPEVMDTEPSIADDLGQMVQEKLVVHTETVMMDENGAIINKKAGKSKKKKAMEVNETQIIKANLDSPSRPKLKKRNTAEPTMTLHTRAATNEIYEIFNQPIQANPQEEEEEEEEESDDEDDYETDGDYTTDAESTMITRQVDMGDDADEADEETSDVKSVSEWSDFSTRKHVPVLNEDATQSGIDDTQASDLMDPNYVEASGPLPDQQPEAQSDRESEDEQNEEEDDDEDYPPRTKTMFVPIPPEDYEPRTRPFRDPVEMANNRLPFMTPITERTESSLAFTERKAKYETPCRDDIESTIDEEEPYTEEPGSSPLREVLSEVRPVKIAQPLLGKAKSAPAKPAPPKGPIIKELQCNPVDEAVRNEIIANMQPSLDSYPGFYDHSDEKYEKGNEIRKFAKAMTKAAKGGSERTSNACAMVTIEFPDVATQYAIRKELGAGAFAPVYLVENPSADQEDEDEDGIVAMGRGAFAVNHRSHLEALKMELPPTPWEFHMMRLAHTRLGPQHRAAASISYAHEFHLYQDEGFLFLPYHPHGSLLDVVNFFRAEPSAVMDEQLAMFFTIELFRTVESLHARSVLHGDLKVDNCLLRLDNGSNDQPLSSQYSADGTGGWDARGVTLIDFGRGIDMRNFEPDVGFIADWKTSAQDCAEMREGRPWTWQIDYHGLAGIVYCLLFGKYIETVRCDQGGIGSGRKYRVRESLKRYWQTEIWGECFDLLLNPGSYVAAEDNTRMPVLKSMRSVREKMEIWLESNCERGVGLKSLMGKVEAFAKGRR
ncbi:checkpoint serine threonine-protein kinase bub1 [Colletotrichum tofieldiae]|uniref:Checkpoint serine threonine-protein kinase bub1 n=1 Tax=Colletotrichum tofieldiae TaxID=708197 RepID=A0A166QPY1_9PEZI|nr:checkpoint serine threonine-protein kinase bub1 [Colletotrichum tofieldiae]GKT55243.1 checkpoint serine threonine-protein kinase bub1 [Colletotrichum tofieldiae]GKT75469.1 checkpoint serine threonine-protein kinase bub1 [Colletotrichum tofieldiae]